MLAQRVLRGACAQPVALSRPLWRASLHKGSVPVTRVFTTSLRFRKDEARARTVQHETEQKVDKASNAAEVKPESVQTEKPAGPAKTDNFMAEQTVSNKEQRKADWAIIKDMAQYLWPKDDLGTRFRVGLSVALLVGAKVFTPLLSPSTKAVLLIVILGPQCTSSVLLQKHC